MVGRPHGASLPGQGDPSLFELLGHRHGLQRTGLLDGLDQGLHHQLHAQVNIVISRLCKPLSKRLVKSFTLRARHIG